MENHFIWDTGRVASDQSLNIIYKGSPLKSGMRCYWQVRIWDKKDKPTPWSKAALWQVALLEKAAGIVFHAQNSDNLYMWQFNNGLSPDFLLRPHICKAGYGICLWTRFL